MTLKTIGHFFYAAASFVHHFIAICEFKLELQSGNAEFGSKSIFCWPCDLEIWRMTLKSNTAPLLSNIKLCASLHYHIGTQTWVTVRECKIWTNIGNFLSRITLIFDGWTWKKIGHLTLATSSFVHHLSSYMNSNWSYGPETASWVWPLWPWPLTSELYLLQDITSVIGNNSWKFHDDTMMGT